MRDEDGAAAAASGQNGEGERALKAEIAALIKRNPDPAYVRKNLSEKSRAVFGALMQRKKMRQSLDVIAFLNRQKVDFAVLKGVSLSCFDRAREFEDLDILVRREDARRVCGLLAGEFGYGLWRPDEAAQLEGKDLHNAHDISLTAPRMIPVEIHYKLFNYSATPDSRFLADKETIEIDGISIPCLRPEYQLLELALHNAFNHAFMCDNSKWARDINLLADNRSIDYDAFAALVERLGQRELVYLALSFLNGRKKPGLHLPQSLYARLRPGTALSYLKPGVWFWVLYFAWDRLFPPADLLQRKVGISPGSPLFILAYPLNWARLCLKSCAGLLANASARHGKAES